MLFVAEPVLLADSFKDIEKWCRVSRGSARSVDGFCDVVFAFFLCHDGVASVFRECVLENGCLCLVFCVVGFLCGVVA